MSEVSHFLCRWQSPGTRQAAAPYCGPGEERGEDGKGVMMSQTWSHRAGGRPPPPADAPALWAAAPTSLSPVGTGWACGTHNTPNLRPRLGAPLSYWLLFLGSVVIIIIILINSLSLGLICKLRIAIVTFFNLSIQLVGSQFPDWGSNPCPLQAKCLTTGPPGNSLFQDQILMVLHPGHTSLLSMSNIPGSEESNFSRSLPDISPAFTVNPNPLADWDFSSLLSYG